MKPVHPSSQAVSNEHQALIKECQEYRLYQVVLVDGDYHFFAARTWYEAREVAHSVYGYGVVSRVILQADAITATNVAAIVCVVKSLTDWRLRGTMKRP